MTFVDELIGELHLLTHWQHGVSIEESVKVVPQKHLDVQILGHELGHIILGDGLSDYLESSQTLQIFDVPQQMKELRADAFAISLVGNLTNGPADAYGAVLSIANSLLRKAVCPAEYPNLCARMPSGVGLIFDYLPDAAPIPIRLEGDHPDMMARFLRILYIAGIGTRENSINHLAKQAIDQLCVETTQRKCDTLRSALTPELQGH